MPKSSNTRGTSIEKYYDLFVIRAKLPHFQWKTYEHSVESVQIRSFSGPYFPIFGLNTGKYGPK